MNSRWGEIYEQCWLVGGQINFLPSWNIYVMFMNYLFVNCCSCWSTSVDTWSITFIRLFFCSFRLKILYYDILHVCTQFCGCVDMKIIINISVSGKGSRTRNTSMICDIDGVVNWNSRTSWGATLLPNWNAMLCRQSRPTLGHATTATTTIHRLHSGKDCKLRLLQLSIQINSLHIV